MLVLQKLAVDILDRKSCEVLQQENCVKPMELAYNNIITGFSKCENRFMDGFENAQDPTSNLAQAHKLYLVSLHNGVKEKLSIYLEMYRSYIGKLCGTLGEKLSNSAGVLVACNNYTVVERCESPDTFYTGRFEVF